MIFFIILISSFFLDADAGLTTTTRPDSELIGVWCQRKVPTNLKYLRDARGLLICPSDGQPTANWIELYKTKFKQIDVEHFSSAVAHLIHPLSIEQAKEYFNIDLTPNNGVKTMNLYLGSPLTEALVPIPSRPNSFDSGAMNTFVEYMNNIDSPGWMIPCSRLCKLYHGAHMVEMSKRARAAADAIRNIPDDICLGALDNEHNGVNDAIRRYFKVNQETYENLTTAEPLPHLTWGDNGKSWNEWEEFFAPVKNMGPGILKSMGLYIHCLRRKFPMNEQPVDVCCDSKTVGEYSYTKVSTGAVPGNCLNNCIYTRDNKPGSKYCFAIGEEKVHCLNEALEG